MIETTSVMPTSTATKGRPTGFAFGVGEVSNMLTPERL